MPVRTLGMSLRLRGKKSRSALGSHARRSAVWVESHRGCCPKLESRTMESPRISQRERRWTFEISLEPPADQSVTDYWHGRWVAFLAIQTPLVPRGVACEKQSGAMEIDASKQCQYELPDQSYGIYYGTVANMKSHQKITVHVPVDLLTRARAATGQGVTATVREGLRMLVTRSAYDRLRQLRGQVDFSINLDELREDREWWR